MVLEVYLKIFLYNLLNRKFKGFKLKDSRKAILFRIVTPAIVLNYFAKEKICLDVLSLS